MSFEDLFIETKGQPILYKGRELKMIDKVELLTKEVDLTVTFVATNSKWKQGIVLQTKGSFRVNEQEFPNKIILWEHTAPKEVRVLVKSIDKSLVVYNAWETEDAAVHYWHNGGAMYVEEYQGVRTYNCNDGYPDDDLNDLIFRIEYRQD